MVPLKVHKERDTIGLITQCCISCVEPADQDNGCWSRGSVAIAGLMIFETRATPTSAPAAPAAPVPCSLP